MAACESLTQPYPVSPGRDRWCVQVAFRVHDGSAVTQIARFHLNLFLARLQADTISFPPLEDREESMALADGFDFLGSSFMDSNTYVCARSLHRRASS